jgi:hypothetical protein
MTLDSFKGKPLLHIILDIDIVEPEAYTTQQRAFPPLITGDDPVIDLLDLLRGETSADSLDNVLVVTLAIETTVDGIFVDTRHQGIVVVMNDCEMLGFVILEDYYPVMSEDFAVIGY